jgi:hypothetical protein
MALARLRRPLRAALRAAAYVLAAALYLVTVFGLQVLAGWAPFVSWLLLAGCVAGWRLLRRHWWFPLADALILFSILAVWVACLRPRNDRDWKPEHSRLPAFSATGDCVRVTDFRAFRWQADGSCEPRWEDRAFDLRGPCRLELVLEPFRDSDWLAHTMLCFGFGDQRVAVSVEARAERGEEYGLFPGALRQFELIYVFGDEQDLLGVRAMARGSRLYLYPVRADPEFVRRLFLDLAAAADNLRAHPRFYRSLRDNCTTTLVKHMDRLLERPIGWQWDTILPGRTGRLLHRLGFMDTDLSYEQARQKFRVDEVIRRFATDPDFSRRIRE